MLRKSITYRFRHIPYAHTIELSIRCWFLSPFAVNQQQQLQPAINYLFLTLFLFWIFVLVFDLSYLLHVRRSCCIACCRLISLAFIFGKANATHLPACLPLIFLRYPPLPHRHPLPHHPESKLDGRRCSCRSLVASCCCCRRRHRRCFCLPLAAGHSGSKHDGSAAKLTFQLQRLYSFYCKLF